MEVSAFDFDLPEDRIALRPVSPRDSAKMLVVNGNTLTDSRASSLADWLQPGDVLVFNDTKVIPARLKGTRPGDIDGPRQDVTIEATLHLREELNQWRAFAKPSKRLRVGDEIIFADDFKATVAEKHLGGEIVLTFNNGGGDLDASIAVHGIMPLPPYIASKRATDDQDLADYQTIYAAHDGAVAAPTAGLHFTNELMASLDAKGVQRVTLTLHVGAGTFLPVKVDDTDDHQMHAEYGQITPSAADQINRAKAAGGRIISVGTTALRLLESATGSDGIVQPFADQTSIFITPGYRFKVVDVLMTNFHLPKSTLYMLVSAFAGMETMKVAYRHAIESDYRFYSYGDTSLLFLAS
jgi:S-adenosylmethionine:tRNA ribosyltransferase-isomerase